MALIQKTHLRDSGAPTQSNTANWPTPKVSRRAAQVTLNASRTTILDVVMRRYLRQPPLPALVVLAVAERFALALGDAEVEFLDVLVLAQGLGLAVHHDAAV